MTLDDLNCHYALFDTHYASFEAHYEIQRLILSGAEMQPREEVFRSATNREIKKQMKMTYK